MGEDISGRPRNAWEQLQSQPALHGPSDRWQEEREVAPYKWDALRIWHLDGIAWFEAPLPRRFHFCRPQTRGYNSLSPLVERCACGSIRSGGRFWLERNARRKER